MCARENAITEMIWCELAFRTLQSGLHSYGQTADNMPLILTYIALVFVAIGVLGAIAYKKGVSLEENGED